MRFVPAGCRPLYCARTVASRVAGSAVRPLCMCCVVVCGCWRFMERAFIVEHAAPRLLRCCSVLTRQRSPQRRSSAQTVQSARILVNRESSRVHVLASVIGRGCRCSLTRGHARRVKGPGEGGRRLHPRHNRSSPSRMRDDHDAVIVGSLQSECLTPGACVRMPRTHAGRCGPSPCPRPPVSLSLSRSNTTAKAPYPGGLFTLHPSLPCSSCCPDCQRLQEGRRGPAHLLRPSVGGKEPRTARTLPVCPGSRRGR